MIQAITLLVIAALVAIDQVIKIAVVNRFAAGGSMDIQLLPELHLFQTLRTQLLRIFQVHQ